MNTIIDCSLSGNIGAGGGASEFDPLNYTPGVAYETLSTDEYVECPTHSYEIT